MPGPWVQRHTDSKWVLLYVERWLKAPMLMPDGTLNARTKGTPQGGPVSPLLANLFLHYGFDMWMSREFPAVTFERFADDAVIHCVTERQARQVRDAIGGRFADIGLELHPGKTKLVYCKDSRRRQEFDQVTFGSPYLTGVPPIRPLRPAYPDPAGRTYGALAAAPLLATVRDRPRRGSLLPYRAARVVAMRTRRAWFCGLANPRAFLATSFAVRLCASAFAFE